MCSAFCQQTARHKDALQVLWWNTQLKAENKNKMARVNQTARKNQTLTLELLKL